METDRQIAHYQLTPPKGLSHFVVAPEEEGTRLDMFLKNKMGDLSRSHVQKWIEDGAVSVEGKTSKSHTALRAGQKVSLTIPEETPGAAPEDIELEVLFEDAFMIVINKPAGMLTHPAKGSLKGTAANAAAYHINKAGKGKKMTGIRPGIVHRLDRDTSGILVIAKTPQALEKLSNQFMDRTVQKVYRAVVDGVVGPDRGEIDGAIGPDFGRGKMTLNAAGRSSQTDFKVVKRFASHTDVEFYPRTGRTHQIRIHARGIGHPVTGDDVYGKRSRIAPRQMLHAWKLTLRHPSTKKEMTFTAPLPKDFQKTLKLCGKPS